MARDLSSVSNVQESRQSYSRNTTPPIAAKMANLFEPAAPSLFDDGEIEAAPPPPKPIGRVRVNGQAAQLVDKSLLDGGRIQYRVILDATGEVKAFVSPPANVTEVDG